MNMKTKILLAILLIISVYYAADCNGEAKLLAPAIIGSDESSTGALIDVGVKLSPGTGNIYMNTEPQIGLATQMSANDAIRYAFALSNFSLKNCDVIVKLVSKSAIQNVDGPSAGIAFAVLTYSAINDLPIRDDSTVTGGVKISGEVIHVGGLYEKGKAAAANHLSYFVIPTASIHERVMILPLKDKYSLDVIQAADAKEAIDFMVHNKLPTKKKLEFAEFELPDVEKENEDGIEAFKELAIKMTLLENDTIESLPANDEEKEDIKNEFRNAVARQSYIISKGYYFTGANDAFENYVDSTTINAALNDQLDIEDRKNKISSCVSSISINSKTEKNYGLLMGADLRKAWAEGKLAKENSGSLTEEKYFEFNDLMLADAWCFIAKTIDGISENAEFRGGSFIDETVWKETATQRLEQAQKLNVVNPEWKRHLQAAETLYQEGKYGAAAMDATFVITMSDVDTDFKSSKLTKNELLENVDKTSRKNMTFFWAKVYQSHGRYLAQTSEDGLDSYRILKYADALDKLGKDMEKEIGKETVAVVNEVQKGDSVLDDKTIAKNEAQKTQGNDLVCQTAFVVIFVGLILVVEEIKNGK